MARDHPLVLLTSDGYCYAKEDSYKNTASVICFEFLQLYHRARTRSGLKHILLVLDAHREHAENGHLEGALKHIWFDGDDDDDDAGDAEADGDVHVIKRFMGLSP